MANLIDLTLSDLVNKVKSKEISSKKSYIKFTWNDGNKKYRLWLY